MIDRSGHAPQASGKDACVASLGCDARRNNVAMLLLVLCLSLVPRSATAQTPQCLTMSQAHEAAKAQLGDRQTVNTLARAAEKGCADLMRTLIGEGAPVNARRREGDAALHHAVRSGNREIVQLLLDAGADIEQRDLAGVTALTAAIEAGRDANVAELLRRGAKPEAPGRSGASPLTVAAFFGREAVAAELLALKVAVDTEDNTGKDALTYACARGFTRIVRRLIDAGADPNRRHAHALTALTWAAGHSNDVPESDGLATVELLLARGADINAADDRGRTALMTAAELGREGIVRRLLAAGADERLRDSQGKSALDLAEPPVRPLLGG